MICGVFSLIHKKNLYPYSLSIYLLWLPLNIIYNLLTPILKRNNLKVALKIKHRQLLRSVIMNGDFYNPMSFWPNYHGRIFFANILPQSIVSVFLILCVCFSCLQSYIAWISSDSQLKQFSVCILSSRRCSHSKVICCQVFVLAICVLFACMFSNIQKLLLSWHM